MDEEISLFKDKEEFIENHLESLKKSLSENLDKLPNRELPFMEPHLRAIYFETYFLIAQGFYNSSLVLCGILLESLIKEKLFMDEISDEELEKMNFGQAIKKAKDKNLLSPDEINFLEIKRDNLRNPYAHYNKMKLSEGIYFPVWKIENPVEKLISLQKRVNNGELTEAQARQELIKGQKPEFMSSKEFRPLSQTAKSEIERNNAPLVFLEIDKFTREFARKYFKPKEKEERH